MSPYPTSYLEPAPVDPALSAVVALLGLALLLAPAIRARKPMVSLLGRTIPSVPTSGGVRPTGNGGEADPARVERDLEGKFGERLPGVRAALRPVGQS